ncbi:MAG: hypothetical protein V8R80_05850 [Eubacterium sp.]
MNQAAYFGVQYIEALGYDTVSHIITEYEPEKAKEILDRKYPGLNSRLGY